MKINHIAQAYGVDLLKAAGNTKEAKGSEKTRKADEVSVSKEARSLQESQGSVETTAARVSSLPAVRWDKVDEVREKIQNGFYETQSFRSDLADRLIRDLGLNEA